MNKKILSALKVSALALVLSFGLSYVYAWTAPASNPPAGNVSAPINTSGTAQIKTGGLTVGGLTSTGDVCITGKCLSTVGGGGSYIDTDTLGAVMNRGNVATTNLDMGCYNQVMAGNIRIGGLNGIGHCGYMYNDGWTQIRFPALFAPGAPNQGFGAGLTFSGTGKFLTSDASGNAYWDTPVVGGVTSFNGATGAVTGVTSVNGQTGAVTVAGGGLGYGQTWTSVWRPAGVDVLNDTGKPIMVHASGNVTVWSAVCPYLYVGYVNGVAVDTAGPTFMGGGTCTGGITFLVPAGATYRSNFAINMELR